jgi:hypothetical protein
MQGCRSEFNAGHGYTFTGTSSSLVMSACNTDRSGRHGFNFLTLDGGRLPLLVGCQAKRDGSSAGTWAGFNFQGASSGTQSPGAVLQACNTYVGRDDDGTGLRGPAYGVQTLFARRLQISGGWIEGTTGPYNDTTFAVSKASGVVQATVDPTTGTQTISNSDRLDINGSGGASRALRYFTRASGQRWEARSSSAGETGSNVGSDYEVARFSDAGTEIDIPLRLTRSTGDARFLGNVLIGTAGKGLQIKEGTNARMGLATLAAGTVTVANTSVTANTRVAAFRQAPGGTLGHLSVTTTPGTGFTLTSSSAETSAVAWVLFEAA